MTKMERERRRAQTTGARWRDWEARTPSAETLRLRAEWRESAEGQAWLAKQAAERKKWGLP